MTKFLIINQQKLKIFLYYVLCLSLIIISYACGEAIYSSSETEDTGSITFSVEWRGAPTKQPYETGFRALDCGGAGVASVEAEIYDENNSYLTSGGPWECEAHAGTIENVPEGTNRKVVVLGRDVNNNVIYRGEKSGITVTAGQTTNAGTIVVEPINTAPTPPTNVIATAGDEQVLIIWDSVTNATSYNIYWSTSSAVTAATGTKISNATSPYTHVGRTNGTTYYYVVTAENSYGESADSSEVNATPSTLPTYTNSLGMTFNLIPAGTFTMGSPDGETQHEVTLTQSFYMQTTEVTQSQWVAVMGSNPSYFSGCSDCPVEKVTWDDIQVFITELNTWGEGSYLLPTEAEWEYAARAGTTTAFANGDITYYSDMLECNFDSNLDVMGWYCYNSSSTQSVAQKNPNVWGLYDMHGNVYEWCQDWYGTYPSSSVTDPTGPTNGSHRVVRGGCWDDIARHSRSAFRNSDPPDNRYNSLGFRIVLSLSVPKLPDTGQTQSYTTTFGEDSDYTINPPSYTDNGNGTIADNITSLM